MDELWIVVANQTHARVFAYRGGEAVRELDTLSCPEARRPEREELTAAPGRSHDRMGPGRHAMEPHTTMSEQLARGFAHRIAEHVEESRKANAFRELVLVAAPGFLGLLRNELGQQSLKLVVAECHKNLVKHDLEEILAALPDPVGRWVRVGDQKAREA